MSVSPKESSLFGGERIKALFPVQTTLSSDAEYYVLFEGAYQRHVTKATLANEQTIRAVIPEHRTSEVVKLIVLCQNINQDRHALVTDSFTYHEDTSHLLARHLVTSVDNAHALDNLNHIRGPGFDLSNEDLATLDSRLMKVLLDMKLPRDWNLLGEDYNLPDIPVRETLFHLAARLGLQQVTEFLMYQPGSLDALSLQNNEGLLPLDIAKERSDDRLINILLGKNCYTTGGPPWLEKWKKPQPSTMVQRHEYGMATITNDTTQSKRTLDDDIQLLHNMSKVVYDDNRALSDGQAPPVPPHNTATRQRHSMADDYYRQKLYYSDRSTQQQRRSMAEQPSGGAPQMYDIPVDNPHSGTPQMHDTEVDKPHSYSERKALPPHSHRQRNAPIRPRLPSPEPSSQIIHAAPSSYEDSVTAASSRYGDNITAASSSYGDSVTAASSSYGDNITAASSSYGDNITAASSSYGDNVTPPALPKRLSSDRLGDIMPQLAPQSQGVVALDRSRERRPLGNMDTLTFEQRMGCLETPPPILTPHNQQTYDRRASVDREEKQKLRQSSNQIRDRLQFSDVNKSEFSDFENQSLHDENMPVAPPRSLRQNRNTDRRQMSEDAAKKARFSTYKEEQANSVPPERRRHRSGHDTPALMSSSSEKPLDAHSSIARPPSVEDMHKKKARSANQHSETQRERQRSLDDEPVVLRQRVNSLESSPAKSNNRLSLPVSEMRAVSFENISPTDKNSPHEHWFSSNGQNGGQNGGVFKRTMSESIDVGKDPQKKKISRFLSFFKKSKQSKSVEFGLGDSDGSDDETKAGRRYKRNTFSGSKSGLHHRKIYTKHQGSTGGAPGGKTQQRPSESNRMESTSSMGSGEPMTPESSHSDVFSPGTNPYQENVLEDSLKRLQEINEGIYKLRENNTPGEHSRRNSLQRHSTSCPTLADKLLTVTRIVPIEDSEHHRSMQELQPDMLDGAKLSSRPVIVVDDLTEGEQLGGDSPGADGDAEMLTIEQKKQQQRRSSWCPEEERKKEEKTEKQILLGVSGRSQSLSSLEGDADDSEPDVDSDLDGSYTRQGGECYGEGEDFQFMDVPNSDEDDEDEEVQSPRSLHSRPEILISGPDDDTTLQSSDSAPNDGLVLPGNLAKASSSPSIITDEESVDDIKRSGGTPSSNGSPAHLGSDSSISNAMVQDARRDAQDDTDPSDTRLSMRKFLNDNSNIEDSERKDERKKKQSIFSKMGSYRQKKINKERPASASHQFVSISISNSTACDMCGKPMANKSCLQCETQQNVRVPGANLKSSQSFKEPSRNSSNALTNKQSLPVSHSVSALGKNSSSKALSEEKEEPQGLVPESSNMTDALSVSMESIEEPDGAITQISELELERDLYISSNEPEAWSVTVDKKTLKKMTAKDIKRQDIIWEFIQTEKSHCRTLRIMQKIFYNGLLQECELSQEMVDRIFPRLFDLLDIHLSFLHRLLEKQRLHADKSINTVGDLFKEQFDGVFGDRMKDAYGEFCSRHKESVQLYKDFLKSDKKLQIFAKKCSRNSLCKRLDVPACILLVTQRPTKYPLLLESLLKATKEPDERDNLTRSLVSIRDVLAYIDKQIDEHEKYQKLIEIYNKVDARSSALFKQKKFKKSDLLSNNRKLLHEGVIKFMNARGKTSDVLAVILSDVMFFLVESNQKYTFFSQDNKSSVIALSKLLVREKGDTKDSKGIYLICQSKTEPEMYELVCKTPDERKYWILTIKSSIVYCLEQEAGSAHNHEDKKVLEARTARLRQLIDNLAHVDHSIRSSLDSKNKVLLEMVDLFGKEDNTDGKLRSIYKDEEGQDLQDAEVFLQTALLQGEKLMALLQTSAALNSNGNSLNLSRSVSSVGEHSTGTTTPPLPKRADTFSGFESKENHRASAKKRFPTTGGAPMSETRENIDTRNANSHSQNLEEADSGLGLDTKCVDKRRTSVAVPYLLQEASKHTLPKEKINRRMSTSFLQQLLNKQHLEKEDSEGSSRSDKSSDGGSLLDLSNLSPAISISNLAVSREQCACLAQLLQSVHGLAAIASQQSTEVESFKAQLAEANAKISRLYSDPERYLASDKDKKNTYHHDKQLEELRNLQEQINQDRAVFEKAKTKQNLEIHQENQEIRGERDTIAKQKAEVKAQRDELQRQREALQKQMDLFEQQKSQFNKTLAQTATRVSPSRRERSESPASSGSSLERTHKRAGSTDLHSSREGSPFEPLAAGQSTSLKEPLNMAKARASNIVVAAGVANSNAKTHLPMHLKTATNDVKLGSVVQQMPLKLAGRTAPKGSATGGGTGMKQVLPFKLSASSSVSPHTVTSSSTIVSSSSLSSSSKSMSTSCASPPSTQRSVVGTESSSHKLTHTRSQPTLPSAATAKTRAVAQHNSITNVIPLKLAESKASQQRQASATSQQRPGSATSSNNSRTPQGGNNSDQKDKSNKKAPEIIYF